MANPKISVLIPLYNRKHYISNAIDSVLRQTFQDFEIIIRDDCSTDGSFEFVQEKYAAEISAGRIKLIRNFKNCGEFGNVARLFACAQGEYVQLLHCDDLILPQAYEHLYSVAKKYNADVVHSSFRYTFDGDLNEKTELKIGCVDATPVDKIALMPNDQLFRFRQWYERGTFIDLQYNLYRQKFILDNEIFRPLFFDEMDFFTLWWLMKAKIFVKTPAAFYAWRTSSDSQSTEFRKPEPSLVAARVSKVIERARRLDKLLPDVELFENETFRRCAKIWVLNIFEYWHVSLSNSHKDGISPELYAAVEDVFRKHLGDDAEYPMFLFHLLHLTQFGKNILPTMLQTALDSLPPPVSEINQI